MGLFSSGKSSPQVADKVWKTNAACMKGIATEGLLSIKKSELALVVTVFEESHKAFIDFLNTQAVPYEVMEGFADVDSVLQKNSIAVYRAFASESIGNNIHKVKVSILILGRYPYVIAEDKIIENLNKHFPQGRISFCLSLDEPLFQFFGSQNIKAIMDNLGMKEDECIEHAMVSKSIQRALEKTNQNLDVELKAHSEKEWFARNGKK